MPKGDIETYHENGTWQSRREGTGEAPFGRSTTKDEAVRIGRDRARELKVEHLIKNMNGTIAEKNSYGNDPRNIPG
ncbi:DUF2188 domain-containing protein [Arthrobacter caoxuetaonis]|uniref:DUF2188 domain-containing protein n=1 Tax=Arthrobacter caoxuetaonis TaxID=2886935 RepID=A0A9X1MI63_9MICC|nr:DUF2188 domain-containing protein [Arthrobacter caoxuetaonis]MCC3299362.1 DUF2188 domain-containing protein [Arthrobacter caoxuetaonis]USQ59145.1 DUF2188 domain-containing protein [Arthrobacter caoxuetaonis]